MDKFDVMEVNILQRKEIDILRAQNEKLAAFVRYIANDYIELSHEKVRIQRDDYVRMARELLNEKDVYPG